MTGKLAGKTALVTGGGTGIGWGIAQASPRKVAAWRSPADGLPCWKKRPKVSFKGEPKIACHEVDVVNLASVQALFAWAEQTLGPLDVVVNNAGVNIKTRSMAEMQPKQWDYVMGINTTGVYNCLYAALPSMKQRGDGLIVNISSISGKRAALGVAWRTTPPNSHTAPRSARRWAMK